MGVPGLPPAADRALGGWDYRFRSRAHRLPPARFGARVDRLVARLADHPAAIVGRFPGSPHAVTALLAGPAAGRRRRPLAHLARLSPGRPARGHQHGGAAPVTPPVSPKVKLIAALGRRRRRAASPCSACCSAPRARSAATSPASTSGSRRRARAARPSTPRASRRGPWPSRSPAPGSRPSGSTTPAATSCATGAPSWPSRPPPPGQAGSRIYVDDQRQGYNRWYPYIGGRWGTFSGPGETFRGGGPAAGK